MTRRKDINPFEIKSRTVPMVSLMDMDVMDWDPLVLLVGNRGRDPSRTAQVLAEGFCILNRPILRMYDITADVTMVRSEPKIRFVTHGTIGAFPLRSPITGQCELAGVVKPWIQWQGVGPMLSAMGMKIVPELVRLPVLPRSDREVPGWVIGSVVIKRLEKLLANMVRKYEFEKDVLRTPKGRINWREYAIKHLSKFDALGIPCEFPVLEHNATLMSVIHYTLRRLQGELNAERSNGSIVLTLLAKIDELLTKVSGYVPLCPSGRMLQQSFYSSMEVPVLDEGLEGMRWCAENRGLGGTTDLNGLAWRMNMPDFFEAYVESIAERSLRYSGGRIRVDRLNETKIPIYWHANKCGMMGSLKPDILLLRNNQVIIVDAKFKRYGQLQRQMTRREMAEEEQESQRHDIHQVVAYAACYPSAAITTCLVYPTSENDYQNRLKNARLHQHGRINSNGRIIDIIVTYVPLRGNIDDVAKEFSKCICHHEE